MTFAILHHLETLDLSNSYKLANCTTVAKSWPGLENTDVHHNSDLLQILSSTTHIKNCWAESNRASIDCRIDCMIALWHISASGYIAP